MFFPWFTKTGKWKKRERSPNSFPAGEGRTVIRERAFVRTFLQASMTLEAACVLPLFLAAMLIVMQFGRIGIASSVILAGMHDAAKDMAAYAYIRELGITPGDDVAGELISGGLSAAYAKSRVEHAPGYVKDAGKLSLLQTTYADDVIDLAGTYQLKHSFSFLPSRPFKSVIRARVRAWTGRAGSGGGKGGGESGEEAQEMVYMAETGSVYHKDPNCTHIRLSIQEIDRSKVGLVRNVSGGKYHACSRCKASGASSVYVTKYGDKYHGSLECSGLKRTISRVPVSEVKGCRPCSKCGGG